MLTSTTNRTVAILAPLLTNCVDFSLDFGVAQCRAVFTAMVGMRKNGIKPLREKAIHKIPPFLRGELPGKFKKLGN